MATSKELLDTELLRLVTAGSVDDGKSTLIGRLLYDTKQILVDQLEHIEDASRRRGHDYVDLALLTDGLRAEREQGITIDVAYRSFVTPRRRFQLADAPGHVQYTRNMVTGASTADVAVVLVDARKGVIEQTRRHSYIVAMLAAAACRVRGEQDGSRRVLGGALRRDHGRARRAGGAARDPGRDRDPALRPQGRQRRRPDRRDALVRRDRRCSSISRRSSSTADRNVEDRRFPVQWVIRPDGGRRITTTAATPGGSRAGSGGPGDEVVVLPSGLRSRVAAIDSAEGPLGEAVPRESVTILLDDDVDVSRGDLLADPDRPPIVAREVTARVCWMAERPLEDRARLLVKHTTRTVPARVDEISSVVDIHTLEDRPSPGKMELNDLGVVRFRLAEPLVVDPYVRNRGTGRVHPDRRVDERDGRRRHGRRARSRERACPSIPRHARDRLARAAHEPGRDRRRLRPRGDDRLVVAARAARSPARSRAHVRAAVRACRASSTSR